MTHDDDDFTTLERRKKKDKSPYSDTDRQNTEALRQSFTVVEGSSCVYNLNKSKAVAVIAATSSTVSFFLSFPLSPAYSLTLSFAVCVYS